METRRDERIAQLLQALKRQDKIHLKEAAALLGVSEMTIRRDLQGHDAPVTLLGGYIVLEPRGVTVSRYLLSDEKTRLVEEKRHAARIAASLARPHQTLFSTAAPPRRGLSKRWTTRCPLPASVIR